MRLVLTSDDGFEAPGLAALHAAVRAMDGVSVRVIATASPYSGKGHVVSPQFCCHDRELPGIGRVTVIDGTPADCIRAALTLPGAPRPDWVLSGINYGSNIGIDVYYSGTVAAAREAAILGIPAIAISKLVKQELPTDWAALAHSAAAVLAALVVPEQPAPSRIDARLHGKAAALARSAGAAPGFWNINFPLDGRPAEHIELTTLSTDPFQMCYEEDRDEHGRLRLTSKGNYHERPAAPGTDVAAVFGGRISLTRIPL